MIWTVFKSFTALLIIHTYVSKSSGEKIIIDTDAGGDDAIAILMLMRYEAFKPIDSSFEIIGITCTYGNTKLENVEINVLKTLTIAGRNDIPVYSGVHSGYIEKFSSDNYYGKDGFGDSPFDREITATIDRSKHAAVALVDMVKQNSGNVSILMLGPSTNVAMAITLDKNFTSHVNQFYIMGGSASGIGNIRPNVEFNFAADPVSNFVVFNATTKESQITLISWEIALDTDLTRDWRKNVFSKYDSPYVDFLNKVESVSLAKSTRKQWTAADAKTAACVIDSLLITAHEVRNVDLVTSGKAKGSILIDYEMRTGRLPNTKIVRKLDQKRFKQMLIRYLTCEELPC